MNEKEPLVSIILPVFNGEKFLAKSIESCLNQTQKDLELIIVDDCSTDSSLGIANTYANADPRVKIISNEVNKQLPASLNIGHKAATGKFLTWTSDDNYYEQNAIEAMLEEFSSYDADVVYSNFNLVDSNEQIIFNNFKSDSSTILLGNIVGSCFLYKNEVYKRNNGYDEKLHTIEDYDFWLRASLHSKFKYSPLILYNYRFHANSLTSQIKTGNKNLSQSFEEKLEGVFHNFFKYFNIENSYYPRIFKDFYLYKEINIREFLKKYPHFKKDLNPVFKKYEKSFVLQEIDIKIRSNINKFPTNQNLKNLLLIFSAHPSLLIKYDKRRSMEIIFKCLINN